MVLRRFALGGALCGMASFPISYAGAVETRNATFLSPVTVAALIGDNAYVTQNTILQHISALKDLSAQKEAHFFEIWGALNFSHQNMSLGDSNGGNGLLGFDFTYDHFIFKRRFHMGFFGGFTGNHCDLTAGEGEFLKHVQEDDWRTAYGGFYGNFNICNFDISTLSLLSFSKPKDREYFSSESIPSPGGSANSDRHYRFLRDALAFHSKINVYRSFFEGNDWKIGPNAALCTGNFRQKIDGEKIYNPNTPTAHTERERLRLKLKSVDGSIGVKCEKNNEQFHAHLFLGIERSFCKHWSTSGTDLSSDAILNASHFPGSFDSTKFLIAGGFRFNCTPSCFADLSFSGRYGRKFKSSAIGLALNKVF